MRPGAQTAKDDHVDETRLEALVRSSNEASEAIVRDQAAEISQLRAQAQRFRVAIETVQEGVSVFDSDGRQIFCNRRYAEIYGLGPAEVGPGALEQNLMERPSCGGCREAAVGECAGRCKAIGADNESTAWTAALPNGRFVEIRREPTPEGGFVATHRDVTELAERLSLQKLIDLVPDNLWVKDADSRFIIANDATARQIGLTSSDLIGKTDLELHPAYVAQKYFAEERRIVETGEPLIDFEEWVVAPNGAKIWISTTKVPFRDENGRIVGLFGISRDITARKQIGDALAAAQDRMGHILSIAPAVIYSYKATGDFAPTFVSRNIKDLLGYDPREFLESADFWRCGVHPDDFAAAEAAVAELFKTGVSKSEYRFLRKDGSYCWVGDEQRLVRNNNGQPVEVAGSWSDITARKQAEALRDGQAEILEMIATGAPLADVLDRLARLVESQLPGTKSSVLLLDEDGVSVRLGAAPSLPAAFGEAIEGLRVGSPRASCSAAAARLPVAVADVATDPLWSDLRELAAALGFRSCWSTPILSHQEQTLGAIALCSGDARELSQAETRLVDVAAKTAAIAIERKRAEERIELMATHDKALTIERLSLQSLIDLVPDNLWVKDAESRFVIANQATARRMGFAGAGDLIGKTDLELCPPGVAQKYYADERRVVEAGQALIDFEEYAPDGKTWISTTKVPLRSDCGKVVGVVGISRDTTTRKLAEALRDGQARILEMIAMSAPLEEVLDRLVRLIESQLDGLKGCVLFIDESGQRLSVGAAPSLPAEYVQEIDELQVGAEDTCSAMAAHRREPVIVADIMSDPCWSLARERAARHGIRSCWSLPIASHQGQALGVFAFYSGSPREPNAEEARLMDVAVRIAGIAIERKLAEQRIQFMATHDHLTGLPNRAVLNDRLTQAVLFARRYDRWATVVFIDLDNFKYVNDSLGHNAGDELLKTVARRMVACLRATDTVLRLGGDEFVVVLADQSTSIEGVTATLRRLQSAIAEPIQIGRHRVQVTGSFGVASYPQDGEDAESLLANADAAMYRVKDNGRNNFQLYQPDINEKVQEKFRMQEELRAAVARNEFVLHYQPQVNLRTRVVFACEALIRWNHPTLGLLMPARFITLAEESGLIEPIGEWVLREACRQARAWQDAGLPPIRMSVNVSARQFKDRRLTATVADALRASGLEAKFLELELTESLIMQDVEQAVATMEELEGLGVLLSIDDFGAGYSSLSALKTFPVARLKIDRAFIKGLPGDEGDKAFAAAVISLGKKLNMKVIAEGVETAEQAEFLRKNKCEEVQGYHLSKPIPPGEFETFLRDWAQRGEDAAPHSQSAPRKRRKVARGAPSRRGRRAVRNR